MNEGDIIRSLLKDIVDTAIVASTPGRQSDHLLRLPVPEDSRRSKSDIFETTLEGPRKKVSGKYSQEFVSYVPKERDHSEYIKLEKDYSHRPNVRGMDWAECPWAHPDQSLFPSLHKSRTVSGESQEEQSGAS